MMMRGIGVGIKDFISFWYDTFYNSLKFYILGTPEEPLCDDFGSQRYFMSPSHLTLPICFWKSKGSWCYKLQLWNSKSEVTAVSHHFHHHIVKPNPLCLTQSSLLRDVMEDVCFVGSSLVKWGCNLENYCSLLWSVVVFWQARFCLLLTDLHVDSCKPVVTKGNLVMYTIP